MLDPWRNRATGWRGAYDRTGFARHAIEPREKRPRKLRIEAGAVLKDNVDRPQAEIIALLQAELALSRD